MLSKFWQIIEKIQNERQVRRISPTKTMIDSGARKRFKKDARKILYKDWLTHIFVHLLVMVCFSGLVSLGAQMTIVSYSLGIDAMKADLFFAFYDVAALFLTIPLCYGVLRFEMKCSDGETPKPHEIFDAFSSTKKLLFSYELFMGLLVRVIPCFLPAIAMFIYMQFFYVEGMFVPLIDIAGIDEIFFMLSGSFLLLVFLGFALSVKYFAGVYAAIKRPDMSVRESFYTGSVCCHNNNIGIAYFFATFVPLFVVSLFSVGILFVVYTVPYFVISFMNMAKYLYEKEMTEGNTKDIIYSSQAGDTEN